MSLYWLYRGGQGPGPYTISVTRAENPREACAALGEPWPSPCVHTLESPRRCAELAWLRPGAVHILTVERLPTSRDYFIEKGYR